MKFHVHRTSSREEPYDIEINTLDELIQLVDRYDEDNWTSLIIGKSHWGMILGEDEGSPEDFKSRYEIEIYDNYRE